MKKKYQNILQNIKDRYETTLENPILTSFIVLCALFVLVVGLSLPYYIKDTEEMFLNVLAEAHGTIFDVAVLGIFIFWLNKKGETRQKIRTYKDEIDDFRLWESEEAAFRTVGNIKRLNRHQITEINLVECYLAKTNLSYTNLKGSNINNANLTNSNMIECNLENARLNQTNLENANLNQAILKSAFASGANFKDAYLIKSQMQKAFLIKANFKNSFLMEADLSGAYVTGADFENANLYKADLRNTIGLTVEQLSNVKSIYMTKLDDEILEQIKATMPELIGK